MPQTCAQEKHPAYHRTDIIFDSDMGPDYDDVGAITLLHAFADKGKINILATIASTRYENVGAVLNVFNTYFHREEIPIAVPRNNGLLLRDYQHWTDTLVANYPHKIKTNEEAMEPVALYRKILSAHPDKSITIVTVGFLTNLAALLKSAPDEYSALNGYDLVKKKVKRLVSMAGKFPAGEEFNIDQDIPSSVYTYAHWPGEVLFSGFEIGWKIKTGIPLIHDETIRHSPVKDVFRISIPMAAEDSAGRKSWDETAVLVAATGYQTYYTSKKGRIKIAADGSDSWDESGRGQFYLLEKENPAKVEKRINELIRHQPQ
ncbi:MAG: nucleoside hydrolase [Bacteroidota bacterium]|nr:nucleoside hydrolase [Bacteroidota bacterium]